MHEEFERRFSEYNGSFSDFEMGRLQAFSRRKEIAVMQEYLVRRPEDADEAARVKDIVLWTQLAPPEAFSTQDVERVRREHLERVARYRARKDWEAWVEEDELDIEAERVLAEVKNYKGYSFK